ncbi:MAG TPA: pyridoxal-phosphate dependent enzyme [Vicinamibacterales bacterium]|nr:pyridoxal-phosphate dependent enzyme [Vicinamibacterales bacterium]
MHAAARQRLAELAARAIPVASQPTPVEELSRLSGALGLRQSPGRGPRLLIKRDDALPFAMGGNKVRKMRLLARQALDQGADTLVTMGGVQSNHARVTAAMAAATGMRSVLVLNGAPAPSPNGNALLQKLFGAEIVLVGTREERDPMMEDVARRLERDGRRPFIVPLGGSTAGGALAYAHAFSELLDQIDPPDVIVHATSSGGTQAGLCAGAALAGVRTRIVGVSADDPRAGIEAIVRDLVMAIGGKAGVPALSYEFTEVDDTFVGPGYGIPTPASAEALDLAARTEGLLLDPVYTAKAMAMLIAAWRRGAFAQYQTVLFWHTGGIPALFA